MLLLLNLLTSYLGFVDCSIVTPSLYFHIHVFPTLVDIRCQRTLILINCGFQQPEHSTIKIAYICMKNICEYQGEELGYPSTHG